MSYFTLRFDKQPVTCAENEHEMFKRKQNVNKGDNLQNQSSSKDDQTKTGNNIGEIQI